MAQPTQRQRPRVGRLAVLVAVPVSVLLVLVYGCRTLIEEEPEDTVKVQVVYVMESSWFATDPAILRANLDRVRNDMRACASLDHSECLVQMYVAQGAQVSANRVPSTLKEDSDTGYWYKVSPKIDRQAHRVTWNRDVERRIAAFLEAVEQEIVPESYGEQPKGCVNLIANIGEALRGLSRSPGDRNVIKLFASGISNCSGQPFYPLEPFPAKASAVNAVLKEIGPDAALMPNGKPRVCFEWSQMFGEAYLEGDVYISNEQRQILLASWDEIMQAWGAVQGNRPGAQGGDCLTMKTQAS